MMAAGHLRNDEEEALLMEICDALPYGGDLETVRNLLHSILYIGVV
jgi:hypothetical protein